MRETRFGMHRSMKNISPPLLIELPRMLNNVEERQQLVRNALAHDHCGADQVVDRALWAWQRLACQLTPLIGDPGFSALYGRALRLTLPVHPLFSAIPAGESSTSLLTALKANLDTAEAGSAMDGIVALTDTFTGLLSAMIGEPLTIKVLQSAWVGEPGSTNKKEASE